MSIEISKDLLKEMMETQERPVIKKSSVIGSSKTDGRRPADQAGNKRFRLVRKMNKTLDEKEKKNGKN